MQHVKLARDRRKRKSRIKALIFFIALFSIFTGFFLHLNNTASDKIDEVSNPIYSKQTIKSNNFTDEQDQFQDLLSDDLYPASAYTMSFANEVYHEVQILADTIGITTIDNDATSYDDDVGKDDEVEEVKTHDELDYLN